jgi:hypothetical protein
MCHVSFVEEGHAGCLTLFLLEGMSCSSTQGVSSTSMGWGVVSPCDAALFPALGRLLAFFLGFDRLAMSITSTGTSLTPRECSRDSHSITLALAFLRRRFTAFTVSWFLGMEKWVGLRFFALRYSGK